MLQHTHVLFLANYHQQCESFLEAFYGFLGGCVEKGQGYFGHVKHLLLFQVYSNIP